MARPRSLNKRMKRLAAPANEQEVKDFDDACRKVDMQPPETLRKLAKAFKEHVDEFGFVVLPLKFTPPEKREKK